MIISQYLSRLQSDILKLSNPEEIFSQFIWENFNPINDSNRRITLFEKRKDYAFCLDDITKEYFDLIIRESQNSVLERLEIILSELQLLLKKLQNVNDSNTYNKLESEIKTKCSIEYLINIGYILPNNISYINDTYGDIKNMPCFNFQQYRAYHKSLSKSLEEVISFYEEQKNNLIVRNSKGFKYEGNKSQIELVYKGLKREKLIDESTTLIQFYALFGHADFKLKIIWTGFYNSLAYFVKQLSSLEGKIKVEHHLKKAIKYFQIMDRDTRKPKDIEKSKLSSPSSYLSPRIKDSINSIINHL